MSGQDGGENTRNGGERNAQKRNGGTGRRLTAGAAILALLALLGGGGGIGFGLGNGLLPGSGNGSGQAQQTAQQDAAEAQEKEPEAQTDEEGAVPDTIVVSISQDAVTINGNAVANAEELRAYIEEYNADGRTFRLEETQSILETYEWVTDTFMELGVALQHE